MWYAFGLAVAVAFRYTTGWLYPVDVDDAVLLAFVVLVSVPLSERRHQRQVDRIFNILRPGK